MHVYVNICRYLLQKIQKLRTAAESRSRSLLKQFLKLSDLHSEESMAVAVSIKIFHAVYLEPGFAGTLRIEFHQLLALV